MSHLQGNTNKGNSFVLPPCKDIMRDAAVRSNSGQNRGLPYKDSSNLKDHNLPSLSFQDSRSMPSLPSHQPSRQQSSYLPSFPLPTSPSGGPHRHSTGPSKTLATNFHPYASRPTSSGSRSSSSYLHEQALPSPISPSIPRKTSLAESDMSAYGRHQSFNYSDPESIVSPPMTPMTELSEGDSPPSTDHQRHTQIMLSHEMRSNSVPTTLQRGYGHHNKRASEQTKLDRRRNAHLLSEKKRREKIKDGMDRLKQLVPSCRNIQDSKAISKAIILRNTTDYLQVVLNKQEKYIAECKILRQENEELRRLVQSLQNQGPSANRHHQQEYSRAE